jgi:endonuclease V-like protein UPF0215 family
MRRNVFQSMPVVGVEDGSFQKGISRKALLVATLLRGSKIECVKVREITVDGMDATEKLCSILDELEFSAVLLAGVSFAGFNVIDPTVIHDRFKKPIVVITKTKPNNKAVKQALRKHFKDWKTRFEIFAKLGPIHKFTTPTRSPVYFEAVGADASWCDNFIRALIVHGKIPEPIRVARLIAHGLS